MATKLFLRNTNLNGIGNFYDTITTAGSSTGTGVVNTQASGTEIQWTRTAGGTVLEWISGKAPVGGFTLSGQVTFSIWAMESHMNANCGVRAKIFKRTAAGSESQVGTSSAYGSPTEISSSAATEYSWTMTPGAPGVSFAENDRLVIRFYIINVGTMAGSYTCTATYNGADAATGDAFVQINETVTFKVDAPTLVAVPLATVAITGYAPSLAFVAANGYRYVEKTFTSFDSAGALAWAYTNEGGNGQASYGSQIKCYENGSAAQLCGVIVTLGNATYADLGVPASQYIKAIHLYGVDMGVQEGTTDWAMCRFLGWFTEQFSNPPGNSVITYLMDLDMSLNWVSPLTQIADNYFASHDKGIVPINCAPGAGEPISSSLVGLTIRVQMQLDADTLHTGRFWIDNLKLRIYYSDKKTPSVHLRESQQAHLTKGRVMEGLRIIDALGR